MITAYTLVAIIIVLSSDNLYSKGNRVVEAYAKVDSNINTFSPVEEETANEAQIQADELDQNVPLDKVISDNSTGLFHAVIADGSTLANDSGVITIREKMKEDVLESAEKILQAQNEAKEKLAKEKQEQAKEKEDALNAAKEEKEKKELAKAQLNKKKSKISAFHLTSSDKAILQRIVEAEATGEDIKGKMLVANVILNRIASNRFPDTVKSVVFQRSGNTVQFSPIKDGRYWSVNISKSTVQAVDKVLSGEDESQGALFFSARSKADKSSMNWFDRNLRYLFKYGGHEFYTFKD